MAGRPRSAEADAAIIDAALEEYQASGYGGLSVDEVATRAGVSKATIYRRYSSKLELVRDLLGRLQGALTLPDTGSARDDYLGLTAQGVAQATGASRAAQLLPRLAAEGLGNPELKAIVDESLINPRRAFMREIVERGVRRGELRDGLDVDAVTDMLIGSLLLNVLNRGNDPAHMRKVPARVWAAIEPALVAKPAKKR
jgi:AcrR family transcriptional regulator